MVKGLSVSQSKLVMLYYNILFSYVWVSKMCACVCYKWETLIGIWWSSVLLPWKKNSLKVIHQRHWHRLFDKQNHLDFSLSSNLLYSDSLDTYVSVQVLWGRQGSGFIQQISVKESSNFEITKYNLGTRSSSKSVTLIRCDNLVVHFVTSHGKVIKIIWFCDSYSPYVLDCHVK